MNYSLDKIYSGTTDSRVLGALLSMADRIGARNDIIDILYYGKYGDHVFDTETCHNNYTFQECERRFSIAYLYLINPDSFKKMIDKEVYYFHGTNSSALPSILKYGLNSLKKSHDLNIEINSGEGMVGNNTELRDFVSVTDVFEIANGYSCFGTKNNNAFPIVLGMTKNILRKSNYYFFRTDVCETPVKEVDVSNIKTIFTSKEHINIVKKMIGDLDIEVCEMDNYEDVFFCYYDFNRAIREDKYNDFINNFGKKKHFSFGIAEIKDFVMKNILSKVGNNIGESGNDEYGHRL